MKHLINTFLITAVALTVTSCSQKQAQQGPPTMPYGVVDVPTRTVVGYQSFPANIQGKINNNVRAKISGYIQELYVDEGQIVTKGQPLFRLETNTLNQSANAAKSGILSAEASVSAAQVEVNKLIPLVEKNIISPVQLETAKANLAVAKSQLAQAKANYGGVVADIDYSIIKSPVSGVVGSLPFRLGSLVGPSDAVPLTTVSDISEVYAYFSMNEKEYFNFLNSTEGKTVKEKLNNLPLVDLVLANDAVYSEKGKIEAATGQIDPQTGTIQFRAVFTNKAGLLNNGNSGFIRIPKTYTDVLVVPESATFEQQGLVYVYKVENDTAYSTKITVHNRVDRMAIVEDGLKKGDKIVVSGIGSLRTGTAIAPQPVNFDTIVNSIKPKF